MGITGYTTVTCMGGRWLELVAVTLIELVEISATALMIAIMNSFLLMSLKVYNPLLTGIEI
jgi:hypothetical protein